MTNTSLVIVEPCLTTLRFRKSYSNKIEHTENYLRFHELMQQPLTPTCLAEMNGIVALSNRLWKGEMADLEVVPDNFDNDGPQAC